MCERSVRKYNNSLFINSYTDYYHKIYRYVLHRTDGDIHSAEDITQEVFTRFYMKIGSLRDHAVRNWLYSASKNVLFEHYRERSMNYACEQIDEVSLLEDEKLTYIDDFDLNIIIDDILKSIGDPLDMLIFEYMALCGLTFSETSKLTRLTAPAVRYRYKIILNRVLASLSKYGINSIGDIK